LSGEIGDRDWIRLGEARHWLDGGFDVVTIQTKLLLHVTPGTLSQFSTQ